MPVNKMELKEEQNLAEHQQPEQQMAKEYPPTRKVLPAMAAIYLAVFLVALDRTIIGTAIPTITAKFDSFGDVAWYEAGFLLPLCALQLTFGRVSKYYPAKWILIALVAVFEIGSIVCASAPTSDALIMGRVICGIGAAGITSGAFLLITILLPLQDRPKYSGGLGAVFGLASILGPVLGGYLTSISWCWNFWINVPIGGISLLLLLVIPATPALVQPATTWLGRINQLDPLGFILIAPTSTCLVFAIQLGGTKYPWNDGRIIAFFVVAGVLGAAFIGVQAWRGDDATVPWKIISQRTIASACLAQVGIGSVLVGYSFNLPIWFQVIQGKSPQSSGLSLLGLLLSNVLAVITGGILTSKLGYYTPFLIIGSAILIVGGGLITTWEVDVDAGKWIGYQVVVGLGLGLTLQQPNIAAQTVLPDTDVSIGLSLLNFVSFLGGTIFITVSQTLLQSKLKTGLKDLIPNFDPSTVTNGGAASVRSAVSANKLPAVLKVYNNSFKSVWYLNLGLSCLIFLAAWGFEWKSVRQDKEKDVEKKTEV